MKAKEDGSGNATPRKRVRRGIEGCRTLILQQFRHYPRAAYFEFITRYTTAPRMEHRSGRGNFNGFPQRR
jgi:hypothetical protein